MVYVHAGVSGYRPFGRIRRVPGFVHLATRFYHCNYVPLWPLCGMVVLENADGTIASAIRCRLRWASVLLGYVRGWAFFAVVLMVIFGLLSLDMTGQQNVGIALLIAAPVLAGLTALTWRMHWLTRGSYEQTLAIFHEVNAPPDLFVLLDAHFGRCTIAERDAALRRIAETRAEEQRLALERPQLKPWPSESEKDKIGGRPSKRER